MSRKRKLIADVLVQNVRFPMHGEGKIGVTPVTFKGGIKGQRVQVMVQKKKEELYEAKIMETIKLSPFEKRVPCKPFGRCGGCVYQRMYYPEEVAYKQEIVKNLLDDAGIDTTNFVLHPSPKDRAYRNKMEYTFGDAEKGGPLMLGMHRKGYFYEIVDTTTCNIVDEDFETIRKGTQEYFRELGTAYYRKANHKGTLRHLVVRSSETRPQIVVQLVTSSQDMPDVEAYGEFLQSLPLYSKITGFVHTINDNKGDVVQSDEDRLIFGKQEIVESVLGLEFTISPESFFQTNTKGAELLYSRAFDLSGDLSGKTVFDLYSGTGTIGQLIASRAKEVVCVEIVEEAVEDAKENAKRNGIENIRFIAGDVLKVLDDVEEKPDMIIIDPPRSGIHPRAIPKIARHEVPHITYISCNPVTFVRDLEIFRQWGYDVEKIEAVDMFPRTPHVETVCLMSKKEK